MFGNLVGSIAKTVYALIWQEGRLDLGSFINEPGLNRAGARLIPTVNKIANALNNFRYFNTDFAVVRKEQLITSAG